jgi:hypothetical protein
VALANLREAVEWLKNPVEEAISREQFLQELDEVLRTATTPAHPAREGVALHTPCPCMGRATGTYLF